DVFVQQLRVVLVREPPRPPGLVEPEPEAVRMNFLTHSVLSPYAFSFVADELDFVFEALAAFGSPDSGAFAAGRAFAGRSATATVRCVMRFTTRNARPIGAGRMRFMLGPWFA